MWFIVTVRGTTFGLVETAERVIEDVGRRVAEMRQMRGWTQQEATEHLKMPLKNLQRIEAGMNVTLRTLVRVARGLGVRACVLLDEPESGRSGPRKTLDDVIGPYTVRARPEARQART